MHPIELWRKPLPWTTTRGLLSWVAWMHALSKVVASTGSHTAGLTTTLRPLIVQLLPETFTPLTPSAAACLQKLSA